ncbi:hypothetical protein V6U81_20720 [Micromonospora sp. CPCC 205711]|uniref:hypothetical protein n=1 Tax=Micromonospora sp. CPCC 205547 TaxID=3122400 RepID=UPI002FEF159B
MRSRLLAVATATAVAALGLATPAHASHSWGNYHWARTANPFTLKLDNNVDSSWSSYLSTASSDWTASSVLNTTVVTGSFGSRSSCTPTTGHVEVCNGFYGGTGWLGIASISVTTGNHISAAYVKVNDTYFTQSTYNTPAYRRMVMCQEVGHTFGLDHQDTNQTNTNLGTCMDYTRNPAGPPSNEHPNSHDFTQLQTIYSHLDSFNTPTLAPALAGASRTSWGKRVSGAEGHGVTTYVRETGRDSYTVTRVIWAG